jgi:hypothetical protein
MVRQIVSAEVISHFRRLKGNLIPCDPPQLKRKRVSASIAKAEEAANVGFYPETGKIFCPIT